MQPCWGAAPFCNLSVQCFQVYSYFLGVYKVSVAVGLAGYALLILEVCGMGPFLRKALEPIAAFMLLWYGLYFGVLGRDCAEVAADRMVSPTPVKRHISSRQLQLIPWGLHKAILQGHLAPRRVSNVKSLVQEIQILD